MLKIFDAAPLILFFLAPGEPPAGSASPPQPRQVRIQQHVVVRIGPAAPLPPDAPTKPRSSKPIK
jgi:hypothetical protein